tara:strand:+ start:232 stop:558 length:327 start_codon:yes stop_codon:yes gene_type:complete
MSIKLIMHKILSILLISVIMSSHAHTIEPAHFAKVGVYSLCDVNCEDTKHFSSHDDCDICNKKVRESFTVTDKESLVKDSVNLFLSHIRIIHLDDSFSLVNSRAPPQI